MRPAELQARVAAAGAGLGWRRAELAVGLADARAASLPESLPESRTRVHLALAGLVAVPQFEVRDDEGRWPARVDLAFPELRVALEHDGAWQGAPGQLAEDRRRLMRLVAAGWRVLHLTAADLHHPTGVVGSGA